MVDSSLVAPDAVRVLGNMGQARGHPRQLQGPTCLVPHKHSTATNARAKRAVTILGSRFAAPASSESSSPARPEARPDTRFSAGTFDKAGCVGWPRPRPEMGGGKLALKRGTGSDRRPPLPGPRPRPAVVSGTRSSSALSSACSSSSSSPSSTDRPPASMSRPGHTRTRTSLPESTHECGPPPPAGPPPVVTGCGDGKGVDGKDTSVQPPMAVSCSW